MSAKCCNCNVMELTGVCEISGIVLLIAQRAGQREESKLWFGRFGGGVPVLGKSGLLRKSLFLVAVHTSQRCSERKIGMVQDSHITIKSTRTPNSMRCIELGACYLER